MVSALTNIKKRDIGLDLLRIISMSLVTIGHYIGYTNAIYSEGITNYNFQLLTFLKSLSLVNVNLFVLISGYFLIVKKVELKKLLFLYFDVYLASVLLTIVGLLLHTRDLSAVVIAKTFFPFVARNYWYPITYTLLFLLVPYINNVLIRLSKSDFKKLVLFLFLFSAFFCTNPFIKDTDMIGTNKGIVFFIVLYIISAYLRLHWKRDKTIHFFIFTIVLLTCTLLLQFECKSATIKEITTLFHVFQKDAIFALLLSVSLFCLFLNINITKDNLFTKTIYILAKSSFFVYLIQEHIMICSYLWHDIANPIKWTSSPLLIVHLIVVIVVIHLIAILFYLISHSLSGYFCNYGIYIFDRMKLVFKR